MKYVEAYGSKAGAKYTALLLFPSKIVLIAMNQLSIH